MPRGLITEVEGGLRTEHQRIMDKTPWRRGERDHEYI